MLECPARKHALWQTMSIRRSSYWQIKYDAVNLMQKQKTMITKTMQSGIMGMLQNNENTQHLPSHAQILLTVYLCI